MPTTPPGAALGSRLSAGCQYTLSAPLVPHYQSVAFPSRPYSSVQGRLAFSCSFRPYWKLNLLHSVVPKSVPLLRPHFPARYAVQSNIRLGVVVILSPSVIRRFVFSVSLSLQALDARDSLFVRVPWHCGHHANSCPLRQYMAGSAGRALIRFWSPFHFIFNGAQLHSGGQFVVPQDCYSMPCHAPILGDGCGFHASSASGSPPPGPNSVACGRTLL